MQPVISSGIEVCFVLLAFILFGMIVYAVRIVSLRRSNDVTRARKITLRIGFILIFWLMALKQLSALHFLDNWNDLPPHFVVVLLPPVIGSIVLALTPGFGSFLQHVPRHWLIAIQSFRIIMELILWALFLEGVIGKQMTFEGRNFDVLVGLTAVPLAYLVARRKLQSKSWILAWNIAGILLLANIVAVAVLSAPFPFRTFTEGPANTMIAYFPFVWLPGFVVPVAFAMHLFSIQQAIIK
ncbi:MAG TPA: hypothetical protein PLU53_10455 [Bacteroidia bacterium]|nr:hypothetical protein [Bacteroidia bacterium]